MFGLMPWRRAERVPARDLEWSFGLMRSEFGPLFERFFAGWPTLPEVPIEEMARELAIENREKEIVVRAEVPGFEPKELVVEVTGNLLTIRAEKEKEEKKNGEEKVYGKMERTILLPVGVEPEKIEAVCKNGVLEITLPKKPEALTRKIEVKT
jgi:HSP20 family protein